MRFGLQVRRYGKWVGAIAVLAVMACISGAYILINQRLETPIQKRYKIYADVASATGLTPGQGQAVNVAGVRVGQITAAELIGGRARMTLSIDPGKLPKVYDNATAALVSNTPLKDMIVELGPGGPPGKPLDEGDVIPIARTESPIDSDELTNALDADTRDFLDLLVRDASAGFAGRGEDANQLLRVLEPTARQIEDITGALAARRVELRRLVGNLAILTQAAGEKDQEIGQVVEAANSTLAAVAGEDQALTASLDRLPGTLSTVRATLANAADFSEELVPTLNALLPAVRKLPPVLADVDPLLEDAAPLLRNRIRPLVRELVPIAKDLEPTTRALADVTPSFISAANVLLYVVNTLAYNPAGSDEGYLFWTAWFAHNAASFLSTEDAHGAAWRGLALVDCDTIASFPQLAPLLDIALGFVEACNSGGD